MPTTPSHALRYPQGSDNPNIPLHFQNLATDVETALDDIAPDQIRNGSPGQIIVCNSSGVPQYRALSGDATLSDSGAIEIADGAVGTNELASAAVTGQNIDNKTIGRSKLTDATLQTKRVNTGMIAPGGVDLRDLVWPVPFADPAYNVALSARSADVDVDRLRIVTQDASYITVIVTAGAGVGQTGYVEIQAIAIHD